MKSKIFLWGSLTAAAAGVCFEAFTGIFIPWIHIACPLWFVFVGMVNVIMNIRDLNKKKKRRRKVSNDTQPIQLNRSINFAETQIK